MAGVAGAGALAGGVDDFGRVEVGLAGAGGVVTGAFLVAAFLAAGFLAAGAGGVVTGVTGVGGTGGAGAAGILPIGRMGWVGGRSFLLARICVLWPHGGGFWFGFGVLARIADAPPSSTKRSSGNTSERKWISTSPVRSASMLSSLSDCVRLDRT